MQLNPALLWLQRRPAVGATIQPLAWELSYVAGEALKKKIGVQGGAVG